MYYIVTKHSGYLRTLTKCALLCSQTPIMFYDSIMTWLWLLYLVVLGFKSVNETLLRSNFVWCSLACNVLRNEFGILILAFNLAGSLEFIL